MAYTGIRKPYKEEFAEVDINKIDVSDKIEGVERKKLKINDELFTCIVEGVKVGYGIRLFFKCEHCGQRVTKLYIPQERSSLFCRHCLDFNYISQQATKTNLTREFHLMIKYGTKINPTYKLTMGLSTRCPFKPKNMHHKTYERLRNKYIEAQYIGNQKWLNMVKTTMNWR